MRRVIVYCDIVPEELEHGDIETYLDWEAINEYKTSRSDETNMVVTKLDSRMVWRKLFVFKSEQEEEDEDEEYEKKGDDKDDDKEDTARKQVTREGDQDMDSSEDESEFEVTSIAPPEGTNFVSTADFDFMAGFGPDFV